MMFRGSWFCSLRNFRLQRCAFCWSKLTLALFTSNMSHCVLPNHCVLDSVPVALHTVASPPAFIFSSICLCDGHLLLTDLCFTIPTPQRRRFILQDR